MLQVREDISAGVFFVEINLQKKKWLLCGSYNPKKSQINTHIESLNKNIALYLSRHDSIII